MSKKYFYPASPTRKHFALSELPEQEIAEILEEFQPEGQEINDPLDCSLRLLHSFLKDPCPMERPFCLQPLLPAPLKIVYGTIL